MKRKYVGPMESEAFLCGMRRFLDAYVSLNGVHSPIGYSIYSDIFRSDRIL